jgi:RNA polymerase sigma-70 factor (ECF subfamily)
MKIRYDFINGDTKEIETTQEIFDASNELDHKIHLNNRREKRRHTSYDVLALYDLEPSVEIDFVRYAEKEKLKRALGTLNKEQKDLVRKVFFNGEQLKDIAREYGTTYQAIQNRMDKIIKKLQKVFEN